MMRTFHSKCKKPKRLFIHLAFVGKRFVYADNVQSYERYRARDAYSPVDNILPAGQLPSCKRKRRVDVVMF